LLAGLGLLGLIHSDVQAAGEELVRHFHLSPSAHYPRIFLELTAKVTDGWLWATALGSLLYASMSFAEAYGLWRGKAWAEWLAAISGAIYVPFEMVEIAKKLTALRTASLLVNLVVVGYMLSLLRRRPRTKPAPPRPSHRARLVDPDFRDGASPRPSPRPEHRTG
jgi:uncharacterized membrane protein (DUF2068 family)